MVRFIRILSSLLTFFGILGCQPTPSRDTLPIKELIESYKDAPLGKSLSDVSRGLARGKLLLPTEGIHEKGKKLLLKTSRDNQGKEWAFAYTDESELLGALPGGSPYVSMQFRDVLKIISRDPRFGGIFINSTDRYRYLIPREVFDSVQNVIDSVGQPNDDGHHN